MKKAKMPACVTEVLCECPELADLKLQVLRELTQIMLDPGIISGMNAFKSFWMLSINADMRLRSLGYLLARVLSNYTNALAKTKHDELLKGFV